MINTVRTYQNVKVRTKKKKRLQCTGTYYVCVPGANVQSLYSLPM